MKAITICQPYAHLIVTGEKWIENREWPTNYRGRLLIHAGKSRDWLELDRDVDINFDIPICDMSFGAIVGVSELYLVSRLEALQKSEVPEYRKLAEHEHASGTWCWCLRNVRRFPNPIAYRGAQGLFDIPDEVVAEQMRQAVEVRK